MPKIKKCPECRGLVEPGFTELNYELGDMSITIRCVPASVCKDCGQSFIDGQVAQDVNRLVNRVTEDVNSFSKTHPTMEHHHRQVAIAV